MNLIAQGAEAKIYDAGDKIVKIRISKAYRIPEIDSKLIEQRIRKEAKMLKKLETLNIPAPQFIAVIKNELHMEKIEGVNVRDYLNDKNYKDVLRKVGQLVASLHNANIVHGDLTTLNFIIKNDKVYVIDFGLSYVSHKNEDKAVDLYVLEKAIICKHKASYIESFYEGYKISAHEAVLERLETVRMRGRKR